MIFFILLFFYVNCALLEDEFDSDNFGDIYTVIPVLSEVKYPKISLDEVKSQHKAKSAPIKRHLKLNETKEALQSEAITTVFDLLNKLNLSIDRDLVPNLMLLGNKFNINVSKSEEDIPIRSTTITSINEMTILKSANTEDADYESVKSNEIIFRRAQKITCMPYRPTKHVDNLIENIENAMLVNETNETPATPKNKRKTKAPVIVTKGKLVAAPGYWFDGECRCNYIIRSGCYKINPNLYFIIFFDILLSCIFEK